MKYGLDVLYPPTPEWSRNVRSQGWSWLNVYVGGPRAAAKTSWHQSDRSHYPVGNIAEFWDGFLPTYVGRNQPWDGANLFSYEQGLLDGDDANANTGACGFDADTPLCLDLEYGNWQMYDQRVLEYVRGWVERVNAAGHSAGVYSDIDTLNHLPLGELVDFKWGAAWVRGAFSNDAPVGRFDPASPPPWDAWQYATGILNGVSVDCNSATNDFKLAKYSG